MDDERSRERHPMYRMSESASSQVSHVPHVHADVPCAMCAMCDYLNSHRELARPWQRSCSVQPVTGSNRLLAVGLGPNLSAVRHG
jgi:hypothetical protein